MRMAADSLVPFRLKFLVKHPQFMVFCTFLSRCGHSIAGFQGFEGLIKLVLMGSFLISLTSKHMTARIWLVVSIRTNLKGTTPLIGFQCSFGILPFPANLCGPTNARSCWKRKRSST